MADQLLEKVDLIKERMDVSYEEAKDALERASGDVVSALIILEKELQDDTSCGKFIRTLQKGMAAKLRLKKGDNTILEVPAGLGVVGVVGMLLSDELAVVGAVCAVTALLSRCTLEFVEEEREETAEDNLEIQIET